MNTPVIELVERDRVHGSVYTDASIFAEEQRRIFAGDWVYIGHDSEVPEVGDYRRKSLGVQPVILCRDTPDSVQVFFNRCRHRAASICLDDGNTRQFRCEYHGWTYDLSGRLTHVPYADAYRDFDDEAFSLSRPPHVERYRGFVFACLAETPPEALADFLGEPVRRQIDYFCDLSPSGRILVQAGASRLAYQGNWKLQMENSIDGYHPNFTHQSFFRTVSLHSGRRFDLFDGDSPAQCRALGHGHTVLDYARYNGRQGEARITGLTSTAAGKRYYNNLVEAHGEARAREVVIVGGTHMNVFPNLVVLGQQVRSIHCVRVDHTEVDLAPALLADVPDEINEGRLRQYEQFYSPHGGGIHDDIEMFNRVQEGLRANFQPWLYFGRGLHRERCLDDGSVAGQVTDEVPQRAMWRHWLAAMTR